MLKRCPTKDVHSKTPINLEVVNLEVVRSLLTKYLKVVGYCLSAMFISREERNKLNEEPRKENLYTKILNQKAIESMILE